MTNAERQARHKSKLVASGMVQVNLWLPQSAVADFQLAAERVRVDPDLTVARLMSRRTGRLSGLVSKPQTT